VTYFSLLTLRLNQNVTYLSHNSFQRGACQIIFNQANKLFFFSLMGLYNMRFTTARAQKNAL